MYLCHFVFICCVCLSIYVYVCTFSIFIWMCVWNIGGIIQSIVNVLNILFTMSISLHNNIEWRYFPCYCYCSKFVSLLSSFFFSLLSSFFSLSLSVVVTDNEVSYVSTTSEKDDEATIYYYMLISPFYCQDIAKQWTLSPVSCYSMPTKKRHFGFSPLSVNDCCLIITIPKLLVLW